jgi:predicted ester cyclase
MTGDNEALIRRWFEEVWNNGREDAVAEMFAEDGIIHGLADDSGQPVSSPAAFRVFHQKFREAFPDILVTVEDTISEGDSIAARCSVRARHTGNSLSIAATQAPIDITGIVICRSQDGKFVECWNNFDFMTMYKQLGAI